MTDAPPATTTATPSPAGTTDPRPGPILLAENLTRLYDAVIGVNEVGLELAPGIHGLIGPDGAGKSTLLRLATGQIRPTGGRIEVLGCDPWKHPEVFHRIGYCPEADIAWPFLSGLDFVTTLAHVSGGTRKQAAEKAERALVRVGAAGYMKRRIRTYSKGMKQRVKVAQAIVHDPKLLVLDEPLNGTDPIGRREQTDLFKRLGEEGVSMIVSSHVLHEIQALTRHFVLMARGRIAATGSIDSIRELLTGSANRIILHCEQAAELGWRCARDLPIHAMEVDDTPGRQRLIVRTRQPLEFFAGLPDLMEAAGACVSAIHTDDNDLSPVFRLLLGREEDL